MSDIKKYWIEIRRHYLPDVGNGPKRHEVRCVEVREDHGCEEIKEAIKNTFKLEGDLILKLRNNRGSLIPISMSLQPNSRNVPYLLDVVKMYQNVKPKPKTVIMKTYNATIKNKLQTILARIENLEAAVPELNEKRNRKIIAEIEELEKQIQFSNKRLQEADGLHWKGMFKKNPLW